MKALLILLSMLPAVADADQAVIPNYDRAREIFWNTLYPAGGETLYCGAKFNSREALNVEHVYAAGWMADALGCGTRTRCRSTSVRFNLMEADLHNLYPAMAGVNGARSNLLFGEVPGEIHPLDACDFEIDRKAGIFDPAPAARGDLARAILYMAGEYGLPIPGGMEPMLLQWHSEDPPSTAEIWRNEMIFRIQGSRNPFVAR